MRRRPAPARRGRDGGAGLGAGPVPGRAARASQVLLPPLRGDLPGAAALPADPPRAGRAWPARPCACVQVRRPLAALPSGRDHGPRGRGAEPVHACGLGGPVRGLAAPAGGCARQARPGRWRAARRRHARAGAGAWDGQDQDGTVVGVCARRAALGRTGAAGRALLLQPGPPRRTPPHPPGQVPGHAAGGWLCGVRDPV